MTPKQYLIETYSSSDMGGLDLIKTDRAKMVLSTLGHDGMTVDDILTKSHKFQQTKRSDEDEMRKIVKTINELYIIGFLYTRRKQIGGELHFYAESWALK